MTPAKKLIIQDAEKAGFTIERKASSVTIVKRHKRTGAALQGITIYSSGTAVRCDTDLSVCTGIRSHKEMRNALGI